MTIFLTLNLDKIICKTPRSHFNESTLENLANHLLKCGGLLHPFVVKKSGFDQYEVVAGELAYYAAVVAQEKNLNPVTTNAFQAHQGSMVNVFVIREDQEADALGQVNAFVQAMLLAAHPLAQSAIAVPSVPVSTEDTQWQKLEHHLQSQSHELQRGLHRLFEQLEHQLTQVVHPLTEQPSPTLDAVTLDPNVAESHWQKLEHHLQSQSHEIQTGFHRLLEQIDQKLKTPSSLSTDHSVATLDTTATATLEAVEEASGEPTSRPVGTFLDALNTLSVEDLREVLEHNNVAKAVTLAKSIGVARQKQPNQQFTNYGDVVSSIKGLGEKTLLKMIDYFANAEGEN